MPAIPLGNSDWESLSENVPRLRLHNMYLIQNPASIDGISRVSRPMLTKFAEVGAGPIYGFWRQEGTFNGDWLVCSDDSLYRVTNTGGVTFIGYLYGKGYCQYAATTGRAIIVRDGVAYSTDGSSLTTVVLPDDVPGFKGAPAPAGSVACINGTFLISIHKSQRFYWINPGEVDPNPLSFASAERTPDAIESINVVSDEIWFLGAAGVEVWQTTGDADIPFSRIPLRVYNDGCIAKASAVTLTANSMPALIWVSDTNTVMLGQGVPTKISDDAVEEFLAAATDFRAWHYRNDRSDFYILTSDKFTYAYDIVMQRWSRWDSYLLPYWKAHLGVQHKGKVYAGSATDNKIWILVEGDNDDGDPVVREVSGLIYNPGKYMSCYSVAVKVNAGWSKTYTSPQSLELRWSDDQGATWSDYMSLSLGGPGNYSQDVVFRSLGTIYRPSRNFEFRFSGFGRFRIDYAFMNEA